MIAAKYPGIGIGCAILFPWVNAQGLQDVGIFQAIDQFLSQTGQLGRAVVGLFAGIEGLGGVTKAVHVEWDAVRTLYSFGLRVESIVMVLRTHARYSYVSPIAIFRCAEVLDDCTDPVRVLALCKQHNRGVTVANASAQYVLLCIGMALVSMLCVMKNPFTQGTYFTATVVFISVVYGGSIRVCQTEYSARRTVLELDRPEGWPDGDVLKSMLNGSANQLRTVSGLLEREMAVAERSKRRALRALTVVTFVKVLSVVLWLGGSPWTRKWVAIAITIILGAFSLGIHFFAATACYLMRIEARDPRAVRECIAAVWLMFNGGRYTKRMARFLQKSNPNVADAPAEATKWYRIFECCTTLFKTLEIMNVVLIACGPFEQDRSAKIGYLVGLAIWVCASFFNGRPF